MSLALTTTHENTAIFRGVSGGFVRLGGRAKKPLPKCLIRLVTGAPRGTTPATVGSNTDCTYIAWERQSSWITSSAWKSSVGGMVRPSACAVLRLMTSSNLVGCSTGRSAGLAPLKILSTKVAAR
jgi:hypothetical protein